MRERLAAAGERTAHVRAQVDEARRAVGSLHASGASGTRVVAEWTQRVDVIVVELFRALAERRGAPRDRLGLFGLGGYGRAELSPYSDLDLLILHGEPEGMDALLEGLLYPLWDSGLDVQCVARTLEENQAVARSDPRSRTSLLEARCLSDPTGEASPRFEEEVRGEIFRVGVKAFVEAKLAERDARHCRYGDTVYLLEPNVKEGPGGLRDIQTALWIAKVRFKVQSVGDLLHKGVVPESELEALEVAREFLLRVRNDLHLASGRREDRLTFDAQDRIAPAFGFRDQASSSGVEAFLQEFYANANRVGHFAHTVIRRSTAGLLPRPLAQKTPPREVLPGVMLRGGELHLRRDAVERNPLLLLEVFETAQVQGADLSPGTLEIVRENLDLVDDRFRRDPRAVDSFFRILRNPRRVATTLMRMHDVHLLDRFVPEFGRIFCRVQRDLYHVYPVDVHSLFAVQELRRLARGDGAEEFPELARVFGEVARPHILYLAALLHDVGKGEGHDHEQRGAEIALAVGDRMGLSATDREYLVSLVANHLLLSHTAQGRDLHDEDLIVDFARRVGDLEALRMLYLLTFADVRAVGPGAWTSWKDLLFRELYEKARAVLERGTFEREVAEERVRGIVARLRREASALPDPPPPEDVDAFLEHSDGAPYLLANPLEALLRHVQIFCRRAAAPLAQVRHVPGEGYTEVLLLTRDRPGLFAQVAGLLAAHRLNILSAVLNTRTDGWVLDVLHVCGPQGKAVVDPVVWQGWERDVCRVLAGEESFEAVVGHRLQRRPGLRRARPAGVRTVRVDNAASRRFNVVDITAADRLGLLYDVTRTFAERGFSIRLAKIVTNLDQVSDSFYVEAVGRGKVTDAKELAALESALDEVLAEEGLA
ncbi:MAG: [protein-PII] uridylyltransferase [Deltaproteobacteria bacterium]|nr:[protein-PII] uridylyltransferase [Deltaproteobacteria bacterium]